MKTYKRTLIAGIGAILLLTNGQTVVADDAAAGDGGWQIIMPTYLWASGLEGDITRKGYTADIDMGFEDIFDHTDVGIQFYLEARKPKFGFFVQPNYLKLSADGSGPLGGQIELEQTWWIVEAGGFYQVLKTGEQRPLTLDVLGGVRYWNIKTKLDVTGGPVGISGSDTTELLDPMIGLRVRKYFTDKFFGSVRADVGGFDISEGDTSRFSWQVVPMLGYDFNQYFSLFGGYRLLATEFETGSGSDKNGANLKMHGVLLGFNFDLFGWLARNNH